MSWHSKLSLSLVPALLGVSCYGQKVQFDLRGSDKATLSHVLSESSNTADSLGVKDVELSLRVPAIDVNRNADGFDGVAVAGLEPLETVGRPELVMTGSLIAVPQGYRAVLTVKTDEVKSLDGVTVQPAQKRFRCNVQATDNFVFDSELYESNSVYPEQVVTLEEVGDLQGLKLMRVGFQPVQMDMRKKTLLVHTQIDASVRFEKVSEPRKILLPRSLYQLARTSTVNGAGLGQLVAPARGPETMLVITAASLKDAVMPLVAWKQTKGLHVDVVTYEEAGGDKDKVKAYIKNYYDGKAVKPSYLLMVGNKTTAPTFSESTGSGPAISDWRFAMITGASDRVPDLLYGRLLADNAAEVTTQVNRIINYEKSPERNGWYHDGMTLASHTTQKPTDQEYALMVHDALKKGTYKNMDEFLEKAQTSTPTNITNALNQGRSWVAYWGHGSGTSWASTNGSFSNSSVDALANARLPVIIDVACLNANWGSISRPFGKAWMTGEANGKARGAVAFYGGSVSISWHEPAVMSVGIAKSHFEKGTQTIGASVLGGQLHLFDKMGVKQNTLENIQWYNLFGDPSMVLRTDQPAPYSVKSYVKNTAKGVLVTIAATGDTGKGVSGLTVAVGKSGRGTLGSSKTDAAGNAQIELTGVTALEPQTQLTITGYNMDTYQSVLN